MTTTPLTISMLRDVGRQVFTEFQNLLQVGNLVARDCQKVTALVNDSVNIPSADYKRNTQIILADHSEVTFRLNDAAAAIARPHSLPPFVQPAALALAVRVESDLLSLWDQFTVNEPIGETLVPLGQPGAPITKETIDMIQTVLRNNKPVDDPRYLVVTALEYTSMMAQHGFQAGPNSGIFDNVHVHKSLYIKRTTINGKDVFRNLAFTRNAMIMVVRRIPLPPPEVLSMYLESDTVSLMVAATPTEDNPNDYTITAQILFGVAAMDKDRGVQVNS